MIKILILSMVIVIFIASFPDFADSIKEARKAIKGMSNAIVTLKRAIKKGGK